MWQGSSWCNTRGPVLPQVTGPRCVRAPKYPGMTTTDELTDSQRELVQDAQLIQPRALLLSWRNDPDPVRRAMAAEAARRSEVTVDLRDDGLLWLINATVFHPRGFALAMDTETNQFSLLGDGSEPWRYGEDTATDALFAKAEAALGRARHDDRAARRAVREPAAPPAAAPTHQERHPSTQHVAQYFEYAHLPEHLQLISQPAAELADDMIAKLPDGPELTTGLRKLLEAKDCFVRAAVSAARAPKS